MFLFTELSIKLLSADLNNINVHIVLRDFKHLSLKKNFYRDIKKSRKRKFLLKYFKSD